MEPCGMVIPAARYAIIISDEQSHWSLGLPSCEFEQLPPNEYGVPSCASAQATAVRTAAGVSAGSVNPGGSWRSLFPLPEPSPPVPEQVPALPSNVATSRLDIGSHCWGVNREGSGRSRTWLAACINGMFCQFGTCTSLA